MLDLSMLADLVTDARLAPSVHNVQPTRWALAGEDRILVLADPERVLPVADPHGRDVGISHGAAIEGMLAALAVRGLTATVDLGLANSDSRLRSRASLKVHQGPVDDRPGKLAQRRATWRGDFLRPTAQQRVAASQLAGDDLVAVTDPAEIRVIAALGDEASMFFLRDPDHRRELLHWMRLSRAHPNWFRDGLNAEAMHLGRLEAAGAGLILGPLFRPLDRLGIAAPVLAEKRKTIGATAILLFHRPVGEDPVATGRAYYQRWLAAEAAGLAACPMSVLADWTRSNRWLADRHAVPAGRELIGVFRVGPILSAADRARARLPVSELIIA